MKNYNICSLCGCTIENDGTSTLFGTVCNRCHKTINKECDKINE